jgi:hypothetical protein
MPAAARKSITVLPETVGLLYADIHALASSRGMRVARVAKEVEGCNRQ